VPAVGLSTVSAHRRSLVTATAAGAVLCALWFVPTAKAAPDGTGTGVRSTVNSAAHGQSAHTAPQEPSAAVQPAGVAPSDIRDLGTPSVLAGLGLAGAGGTLIIRHRRRAAAVRTSQTSSPVTD